MCLIAYQPAGDSPLADDVLMNGWNDNPHGAGYMFVADGALVVRKPFYKLTALRKSYTADHAKHGATSPFVTHFRWATHGTREAGNVHPHTLADGAAALAHNGVLSDFDWMGKDSDTVNFCATVLAHRTPEQLVSAEFGEFLGNLIGRGNKFVILTAAGDCAIVNADMGMWDGGRWYSGPSYLPPKPIDPGKWSWNGTGGSVTRGLVFAPTAPAPAPAANTAALSDKVFGSAKPAEYQPSLYDGDAPDPWESPYDDDDDYAERLDALDDAITDAYIRGDMDSLQRLEDEHADLEAEQDAWAEAGLAMARDGE